ncbi:glycosyltransferase [Nitrobacter sp.]|uniref:glycosyltransferase n=1 Tax=Nitrobacter sp. TaxID=29420 RepID=UPI00321FD96C
MTVITDRDGSGLCVLIPAYRPSCRLIEVVEQLVSKFSGYLIIIDDGSGVEFSPIFAECSSHERTVVIRNAVNLGKGAALKHGINYALTHLDVTGIVTADADGHGLPP